MELALTENNELIVARHGAIGFCPLCNKRLIPKCGPIKIEHWAHKGGKDCDPWWEGETEWHRQWKNFVDQKFREITIIKDGVKHRADVQLPSGIIIEFQRKPLSLDERKIREIFYDKMIWVIHFSRDKILEINSRKMYTSLFEDSYVEVNSFSEGFFQPPHKCPIFLDFDDGMMFWIKEFDEYDAMRKRWFYGRFIEKKEFVNQYLRNPFLSDIEELKITHYHRDYEKKQKELYDARIELNIAKEELIAAKEQLLLEKRQKWYEEGSIEWHKMNKEIQKLCENNCRIIKKAKQEYIWPFDNHDITK